MLKHVRVIGGPTFDNISAVRRTLHTSNRPLHNTHVLNIAHLGPHLWIICFNLRGSRCRFTPVVLPVYFAASQRSIFRISPAHPKTLRNICVKHPFALRGIQLRRRWISFPTDRFMSLIIWYQDQGASDVLLLMRRVVVMIMTRMLGSIVEAKKPSGSFPMDIATISSAF